MSIKVMSKVWESAPVGGSKLLLLLALADFSNDAGESWPAAETLAAKIRLSRAQTFDILKALESVNLIRRVGTHNTHGQAPNHYFINLEFPVGPKTGPTDSEAGGSGGPDGGGSGGPDSVGPAGLTRTVIEPSLEPSRRVGPKNSGPAKPDLVKSADSESQEKTLQEKSKERVIRALAGAAPMMDHTGLNVLPLDKYPEDLRPVIGKVCQLWRLRPPVGKDRAYWIESARELQDACAEFGPVTLEKLRAEFVDYMNSHGGIPPYTVSGPGSLVKSARSIAGRLRESGGPGAPSTVVRDEKSGGFYI